MKSEQRVYYIYRHIRFDKNEVFYVGRGKKILKYKSYNTEYRRAFSKKGRNNFWIKIINKTNYKVEIIFETNDYFLILEKEKEFVKLYGRRDLGLGTLVNLTDGGDGSFGKSISEETKKKLKEINTGKKRSEETKNKISLTRKERDFSGKKNPMYGIKHSEETKKKIGESNKGKTVSKDCKKLMSEERKNSKTRYNPILDTTTQIIYRTIKEACQELNLPYILTKERMRRGKFERFKKLNKLKKYVLP